MRTWEYGVNSERGTGDLTVVEWPGWLELADWFSCWVEQEWMYKVKLPNWPKLRWDKEDEEIYTPREYWGDLGSLLWGYVSSPLVQWCYAHPRRKEIKVELGYDRVRQLFQEQDPEFFEMIEALDEEE